MNDQPNTQAKRERLTKLFEFLKAYTDLRYPPVRDINQQPRTLWLKDLPAHPSVELFRDTGKTDDETDDSHGFVVGHVTPEAYVGGAIALVKNGDAIIIDAEKRELTLQVTTKEMVARRKSWKKPAPRYTRGARHERLARRGDGCGFEVVMNDLREGVREKPGLSILPAL